MVRTWGCTFRPEPQPESALLSPVWNVTLRLRVRKQCCGLTASPDLGHPCFAEYPTVGISAYTTASRVMIQVGLERDPVPYDSVLGFGSGSDTRQFILDICKSSSTIGEGMEGPTSGCNTILCAQ